MKRRGQDDSAGSCADHSRDDIAYASRVGGLRTWGLRHELGRNGNIFGAYELGVQFRIAVLQQHFDDFTEVPI